MHTISNLSSFTSVGQFNVAERGLQPAQQPVKVTVVCCMFLHWVNETELLFFYVIQQEEKPYSGSDAVDAHFEARYNPDFAG